MRLMDRRRWSSAQQAGWAVQTRSSDWHILVVGGGSVTFGLSFALLAMCSQYKIGDSSRLSWNKNK